MEPPAPRSTATRHTRTALRALVVAVLYGLTAWLGTEVAIDDQLTPIWIPAGIALVAVLRWGPWMALGVAAAEIVASIEADILPQVAFALGIGNALEALIAVAILRRLGMDTSIRRVGDALVLFVSIAIAAGVSATIGVGAFVVTGEFTLEVATRQWPLFWSSVVLAVMLVAPFLLAILDERHELDHDRMRLVEATIVLASVVATSAYILDGSHAYATVLLYPLFVWSALRFGVVGASGSILLAAIVAISFELADPSALPGLGLDRTESVLAVQAMLATAAVGNLMLATLLLERDASRVELLQSTRALEDAQVVAHLGSWEWRERDGEVRTSAQLRAMFGLEPGPLDIDSILAHVHPDDREELDRVIAHTLDDGGEFSIEHRIHEGRDERMVLHAGRMTGPAGSKRRRLVATALDITERTSLDRLRDALIATASHELRTPLTSIVGFADTLVEHWGRFDEERRLEFLRIIRTQGRRLSSVVDDTLMQSRLDAGSLVVADDPYPVRNAVDDAIQLAQLEDVEVHCDSSLVALGSQEHLTQIIVNFLTNAAKYGAPPIVVEVRPIEQDGIMVRVIDHGDGIDPTFRERLFERFTRGPGTDAQPGTGLGMSIVRGLAAANGGRVSYDREGDSTVFACTVRRWEHEHVVR